ncbi:hypothetical protein EVAR_60494_1 [Eumeta japonica]|uniref:Uncharacterized protein n=1 Tax=Eumeta variegata TaxID=151549 RepID=A0A4C1ZH13_EUMVA|nr:hypothetical protein EVAR_60494_1 [Eumeta japonica]
MERRWTVGVPPGGRRCANDPFMCSTTKAPRLDRRPLAPAQGCRAEYDTCHLVTYSCIRMRAAVFGIRHPTRRGRSASRGAHG